MSVIRIQAPARLHFGLLGWGPHADRQFGGLGLMIESPNLQIVAERDEKDTVVAETGQVDRIRNAIDAIRANLAVLGHDLPPLKITVECPLQQHHGLGSGTQTMLALAEAALWLAGVKSASKEDVIAAAGRYPRSGVGTHGYFSGGLIVDEGHDRTILARSQPARLLQHVSWPESWSVVTVFPREDEGPSGVRESTAFETLPSPPVGEMQIVSGLLLNDFLPSLDSARMDFHSAMAALEAIQATVGGWFAPAQGGHIFGSARRDRIVAELRAAGLRGLGQSSWGPTLFGFSDRHPAELAAEMQSLFERLTHVTESCTWALTPASRQGRHIRTD